MEKKEYNKHDTIQIVKDMLWNKNYDEELNLL